MADKLHLLPTGDGILITSHPLDEVEPLRFVRHPSAGATCLFVGTTRDSFEGKQVVRLEYESYVPLALKTLESILSSCRLHFASSRSTSSTNAHSSSPSLIRLYISHRLGIVGVEEASILVAASSAHRKLAFEACEWVLERVKEEAQIWKREVYGAREGDGKEVKVDGGAEWKENFPGGKAHGR